MNVILLFSIASFFSFLTFAFLWKSKFPNRRSPETIDTVPEVPGRWPVIGHLHLLLGSQPPHLIFSAMADKYGPIFSLKIGVHKTLVVSNHDIAKECFTTNDKALSSRPKSLAVELMAYNYAMFGFAPYGDYWRRLRKLAVLELLSNHQIQMHGHFQASEVKASLKEIYQSCLRSTSSSTVVLVEMKEWLGNLTLNIVVQMLFGKRYSTDDTEKSRRARKTLRECMDLLGRTVVSDAIPFLRWLDLGGHEKAMKKAAKVLDNILQGWLEEHKSKRNRSNLDFAVQDMMDRMLSILDRDYAEVLLNFSADTIIKATCLSMLLGGTDTTTVTLTWALVLLLNNPLQLKKVMAELDEHIGRERRVEESDLKNLVYLQAAIKETMRLYPAGPLGFPRECFEDCVVAGYEVPKGTRLFVNIHKIQRDPIFWPAPNEFLPERFLTSHREMDVRGQDFELIPFGSGRRICPGISFAFSVLQFTLASLLHSFELAKPSDEVMDMTETYALTIQKATPLEVQVTPRLSCDLYE